MEANDASSISGDASKRARELRTSLGARQDAEVLLAESIQIRQDAARTADALIAEAQQVAADLAGQSRAESDRLQAEAREQADARIARAQREAEAIVAQARVTAEEIRAQAMSEAEEQRQRLRAEVVASVHRDLAAEKESVLAETRRASLASAGRLVGSLRSLHISLETAATEVSEVLGTLPSEGASQHGGGFDRRDTGDPVEKPALGDTSGATGDTVRSTPRSDTTPTPWPTSPTARRVASEVDRDSDIRPRSATEAFMTSSDDEVAVADRELRDLREADQERRRRNADRRRGPQLGDVEDAPEPAPEPGEDADNPRPLGWLFRSAP